MAAENPSTNDKQFTCGICIGLYENPRYLPTCGHTFCENCLLKYTRNVQQEGQGCKFECPVCRKSNVLPEHDEVTLQWIQAFPLNTVIVKMMESMPQSSEQMKTKQTNCDPCKEEGEMIAGVKFCFDCKEVLCKTCTKYHKKIKTSKEHKLIDVGEMPSNSSHADFFQSVGKCTVHSERDVEFYCKAHDAVICSICSTFQHTGCDMTEIAGYYTDVTKIQKESNLVITKMKTAIEHLEHLQKLRMKYKANFQQELKEIRVNIEQMRDQVVEIMDNVVSHVNGVAKQIELEREDGIDVVMSRMTTVKDQMEQNIVLLDTIGQHGSAKHKFVSVHRIKKEFEEISREIHEEDQRLMQPNAKLIIADDLEKLVDSKDIKDLIQIKVTENESSFLPLASGLTPPRDPGSNDLRDVELIMAEEHKISSDTIEHAISVCKDGTVVTVKCIDYLLSRKKTLKKREIDLLLYNPASGTEQELESSEIYGDGPFCAVQIDDTHFAVSSVQNETISIVNLGNELREEKMFENEPGIIVALNNGLLAVAWKNRPAFGMIDISGAEMVQKLYFEQDKSDRVFESFAGLAVDECRQHVIQTCIVDEAVYCFDYTGNPVFKYTDPKLRDPRGVALDRCGNIYVCDYANDHIHKLSPTGDSIFVSVIMITHTEGVPFAPVPICSDITGTGFWVRGETDPTNILYFKLEQNT